MASSETVILGLMDRMKIGNNSFPEHQRTGYLWTIPWITISCVWTVQELTKKNEEDGPRNVLKTDWDPQTVTSEDVVMGVLKATGLNFTVGTLNNKPAHFSPSHGGKKSSFSVPLTYNQKWRAGITRMEPFLPFFVWYLYVEIIFLRKNKWSWVKDCFY